MKVDLDELGSQARYVTETCGLDSYTIAEVDAPTPRQTLALVDRIRDLEGGLADALYWLKPGMTSTEARIQAMERDKANLVDLLHRELVTK